MVELPAKIKPAWQSKTIWINLIMAMIGVIAVWVPDVGKWVDKDGVFMLFAAVNIVLRAVSKDKISFY